MLRAALAFAFVAGTAGCNFDKLGSWEPINERAGKPQHPSAHARSKEIQTICKGLKSPQSDLCRDMDELDKPAAQH